MVEQKTPDESNSRTCVSNTFTVLEHDFFKETWIKIQTIFKRNNVRGHQHAQIKIFLRYKTL